MRVMKMDKRLIRKEDPAYSQIGECISSTESVVGIDARHTHIIIIKKLLELETKLEKLEKRLSQKKKKK
jgi:hypothetical protein